MTSRCQ